MNGPRHQSERLEAALRTALALCAGCGWLASAVVLLERLDTPDAWPRATLCLAWLVFSPLYEGELARVLGRVPGAGRVLARLAWVLEVLPVFLLPVPLADALVFGSMILAQGHLFLASDDDRNAARCLAAAPLLAVIALAYTPSAPVLVLVPVSCLAALVALVLLHGRSTRRRVRRRSPSAEEPAALSGRLVYAVPLGALALVLALGAFLAVNALLGEPPTPLAQGAAVASPLPGSDELPRRDGGDSPAGPSGGYSPDLPFSGGALPFSDEPVMRVRPLDGPPDGDRALYLRDMVLDRFGEGGLTLEDRSLPPELADGDDGRTDGWTWVTPALAGADTRGYQVLARRLMVPELGWTLLFAPEPLAAVGLPRVRYHPDRLLASPEVQEEWFAYELQVARRDLTARDLRGRRARHPRAIYTELPREDADLALVREYADALADGAADDYERVRAVVGHLLTEFEYDLESMRFEGTSALSRFLTERRGYCTHFASAAALMLRTQGVATRVATGFVAHEWQEDEGRWLVRDRDAHAWLEVHFEGAGWLTYDPTPAAGRGAADSPQGVAAEDPPWSERLSSDLQRFLEEGAGGSLGALLATLFAGPAELLERYPFLWGVLSAAALLVASALVERRRRATRGGPAPVDVPPGTLSLYQRLARALAAHGFRRAPGATLREFAAEVRARGGEAFEPLLPITELYYRARFGGRPLEPGEERLVEGFVRSLGTRPAASGGPGEGRPDAAGLPA